MDLVEGLMMEYFSLTWRCQADKKNVLEYFSLTLRCQADKKNVLEYFSLTRRCQADKKNVLEYLNSTRQDILLINLIPPSCAVLTGWYWTSFIEGSQWTTRSQSFVIPDIFCEQAVYVSIWVVDTEEVQVKFVSRHVYMAFTIPGNSLRSVALPCNRKNWLDNVTSAYSMTSSHDVTVYVEYSSDGLTLRPSIALGRKYLVPALPAKPSVTLSVQRNFIAITSVTKNTNIVLRFPAQTSPPPGGPFIKSNKGDYYTLTLGRFQTALVSSTGSFSRTKIEGTAGFLVWVGIIESVEKGKEKVLSLQGLPVAEAYGKEYFVYAPDSLNNDITVHVSGFDTATNFTLQSTNGTSELSVGKLGSTSFRLPKGDYAFIRSIQASITVSCAEPSPDNPNITFLSTALPLTHYLNLANLKLPLNQPNDSYLLVTTFQENCNQSHLNINLTDFTSYHIFTNVSGRTFSIYRTFNDTLLKTLADAATKSGRGLSSRGVVFRLTRGLLRPYPFPLNSFPVFNCPGLTFGANTPATTPVSPWLAKHLRGNDVDEDCDGKMDEELLNELDDDGDGLVDEDVFFSCLEASKEAGLNSTNSDVPLEIVDISADLHFHPSNSYYHASIVALVASFAVAIWAAAMLLGGSLLWEYHRRESARRSTSVSPIFED